MAGTILVHFITKPGRVVFISFGTNKVSTRFTEISVRLIRLNDVDV